MNDQIKKLAGIAAKDSRMIIGLMSGTSMDGLDIALCKIQGNGTGTSVIVQQFETLPYDEFFKTELSKIFSVKTVELEQLCLMNKWIGGVHAGMINACLQKWNTGPERIDLVASHGQTIYHAPQSLHGRPGFGNATLQIGDADEIAVKTGITCISDFRQKHISGGGEGAPLAAYGDYFLFKERDHNVILLNIGGIANFSFLPAEGSALQMFSTDTGPGNTLMDAFARTHFAKQFDEDALIALSGTVNDILLSALKSHAFFALPFPKTTGPELFNTAYLNNALSAFTEPLAPEDVMATLTAFTASTIIDALAPLLHQQAAKVYITGGGAKNSLLVHTIMKAFPQVHFCDSNEKNIPADAKEAVLFAVLANECVAGYPGNYPQNLNNFPAITMGKISLPG